MEKSTHFYCANPDMQLKLIIALKANGFDVKQLSDTRLEILW
jgi:hypothetical protein